MESLRKKSSFGSTVCVPNSLFWDWIDIELTDLRRLLMGALVEHKAREFVERWAVSALFSLKLNFRFFTCLLYLEYSVCVVGFRILCMFLIFITFSLRKSRFGGGCVCGKIPFNDSIRHSQRNLTDNTKKEGKKIYALVDYKATAKKVDKQWGRLEMMSSFYQWRRVCNVLFILEINWIVWNLIYV